MIANPHNNAKQEDTPYHSFNLHPGSCSTVGMRQGTERHRDRQTYRRPWTIYISPRLRFTPNVKSCQSTPVRNLRNCRSTFSTFRLTSKCVINSSLKIPPQLNCVTTTPCEIIIAFLTNSDNGPVFLGDHYK